MLRICGAFFLALNTERDRHHRWRASHEAENSEKKPRRKTMNSAVKLALAGAMSIASVSGVALAQTTAPMVDSTTTTNSTTMSTEGVSIIRLDSLDNDQGRQEHTRLEQMANDQAAMTEAQAEVAADPAIMAALQADSIETMNVIDVETAANGGKIVYVK
jgi:hypothetical protein